MLQALTLQFHALQITLSGEHFGHRVGHGRPRGKNDTPTPIQLLKVAHLQEHIEGPLR